MQQRQYNSLRRVEMINELEAATSILFLLLFRIDNRFYNKSN